MYCFKQLSLQNFVTQHREYSRSKLIVGTLFIGRSVEHSRATKVQGLNKRNPIIGIMLKY